MPFKYVFFHFMWNVAVVWVIQFRTQCESKTKLEKKMFLQLKHITDNDAAGHFGWLQQRIWNDTCKVTGNEDKIIHIQPAVHRQDINYLANAGKSEKLHLIFSLSVMCRADHTQPRFTNLLRSGCDLSISIVHCLTILIFVSWIVHAADPI